MNISFKKLFKSNIKGAASKLKSYLTSYANDPAQNKKQITLLNYNNYWSIWHDAPAFPRFDVIYFNPNKQGWFFMEYFWPKKGYKEIKIDLNL